MKRPIAITVQFDFQSDNYSKLLHTFKNSWNKNSSIPLKVLKVNPPKNGGRDYQFYANSRKLEVWVRNFKQDTIFVDCDTLLLKDISDGFDLVDDVGITETPGRFPINGGVMFFKYTPRSKKFLRELVKINKKMLDDEKFHNIWYKVYSGINQSAIGYLLENGYNDLNILPSIYNLCEPWDNWELSKLLHIKGELRKVVLDVIDPYSDKLTELEILWKTYRDMEV